MSSLDQVAGAFENLRRAFAEGRLAHAYLIVGPPRGSGLVLAESLLKLLFCSAGADAPCQACSACTRVGQRKHPDIHWMEPEKKSRRIGVGDRSKNEDGVRSSMIDPLSRSAYEGGWKAGVLLWADRMTDQACNALLKTLEEPPPRTLLLLVTDQPQQLLSTIRSRCQRIDLTSGEEVADAPWRPELMDILRREGGQSPFDKLVLAGRLKVLLDKTKRQIADEELAKLGDLAPDGEEGGDARGDEEEDEADNELAVAKSVAEARAQAKLLRERGEMLRIWMLWHRDILACSLGATDDLLHFPEEAPVLRSRAAATGYRQALAQLRALESVVQRLEGNIPDTSVLMAALLEAPV